MSFLKIQAVRLGYKEHSKQADENGNLADQEDSPCFTDDGNESREQPRKQKLLSGEKFWRVPKQVQLHVENKSPKETSSQTALPSFPKLVRSLKKDDNKIEYNGENRAQMEKRRSNSAPGCSRSYAQARIRKHEIRLPNIPDLRSLSIIQNQPMKSFVVEGKKLGLAGDLSTREFSSPDSNDNDEGFINSESKVIDGNHSKTQTKKMRSGGNANGKKKSGKESCYGDACEDLRPSIWKTEARVKTAYAGSSRMFNTYLQSRFGKSVYEGIHKKTGTDAGKKYQIYWAPVLINKKVLYDRTDAAVTTQENCEDEDTRSTKERKVPFRRIKASA